MIITNKSVHNWGEKNKFDEDMESEIRNTSDPRLNGIHRITFCPKVGYRLNSGNSPPCFCFVIPVFIENEIPTTYGSSGSSVILDTNNFGNWE